MKFTGKELVNRYLGRRSTEDNSDEIIITIKRHQNELRRFRPKESHVDLFNSWNTLMNHTITSIKRFDTDGEMNVEELARLISSNQEYRKFRNEINKLPAYKSIDSFYIADLILSNRFLWSVVR